MVILKLLFVAVAYAALGIWLYAGLHLQPDGLFFVLSTLSAFAANTWIVWSAFDRDYPPMKKWFYSIGAAIVLTFLTLWAYMMYLVNNYPV